MNQVTTTEEVGWPPGGHILVRDEVWMIRSATRTSHDGDKIRAVGVSSLVRNQDATFFTEIERRLGQRITLLRPEDTELVSDPSPRFRAVRLFLEAVLRKTPLPQTERRLAMAEKFLLDRNPYQQRPAELALRGLRPRILIADVVGLGKTLEIGLTLAELIRRGRGERILVVTPKQVLEQFQREMWTRFAIPLIRLDSLGIQRIQREIPAGRNPFTYYKRVIISIDTLKNVDQYRHHLEKIYWDAVVIDESHNLIGGTSLRSRLVKVLEPRTDALLLASATPHNGDQRSFAKLINLLDKTAIADPGNYDASDIEHVYLRRTKISPEVRDHIRGKWADRGPSVPIRCAANPAEEKVFAELTAYWLTADNPLGSGSDRRLFPYNLLKSFLSSHRALVDTVNNRLTTLAKCGTNPADAEWQALERMRDLAGAINDDDSAKLTALVTKLAEIGVRPGRPTRVVVFSERVPTLKWLELVLPARLGFTGPAAKEALRVLHGGVSDTEEQTILTEFSQEHSPVRILLTGDIASEGVNLHEQCHHLIHYDLPWSLIRIEQRNGRIDRFGQLHPPQFTALILTSAIEGAKDDTTVAEKLLAREEAAHRNLGTAETVTGLYNAREEDDRLTRDLLAGRTVEEFLDVSQAVDLLAGLLAPTVGAGCSAPPEQMIMPSLFTDTEAFVDEALRELYGTHNALGLTREDRVLSLTPPDDLMRRLAMLPPDYIREQRLRERLHLTFDANTAQRYLARARSRGKGESRWPTVAYASDLHPAVEWLVDKLLVRLGRQQARVLVTDVDQPVFLIQGVYSNALGQPTVVEWMAVTGLPHQSVCRPLFEVLGAHVRPGMHNPEYAVNLPRLKALLPVAVQAARHELERRRQVFDARVATQLAEHENRLERYEQLTLFGPDQANGRDARETVTQQRTLARSLRIAGDPFLRVLAVLEVGA